MAVAATGGAWAQTADQDGNPSSFRLPAPAKPAPRAAGPDDDSGAAPTPIAPKTVAPAAVAPAIQQPAPQRSSAPVARQAVPAAAQPAPVPRADLPQPGASPTATTPAAPDAAPAASASTAAPAPEASVTPSAPAPATDSESYSPAVLWSAAMVVFLAAAASGFAWWRGQQGLRLLPAPSSIPPVMPAKPAKPALPDAREPILSSAPDVAGTPSAVPVPAPPAIPEALAFALEATRMSASLVNATLAYRLVVTNTGSAPLAGIEIGGDMISAHASRPSGEQLGTDGAALPSLHGVAGLAPGESVVLGGELRLPLNAILSIRRGDARLFVPLARFSAQAHDPVGQLVSLRRAFLVGQSRSAVADKLQPFRLDLGPRLYSELGQREVESA